jgi:hypothetical protein
VQGLQACKITIGALARQFVKYFVGRQDYVLYSVSPIQQIYRLFDFQGQDWIPSVAVGYR